MAQGTRGIWRAIVCSVQTPWLNGRGVPVLMQGPPGIGKTQMVKALGEALGLPVVALAASTKDPTDFTGTPFRDETRGVSRYLPHEWAKSLADEPGLLFIDEVDKVPLTVQPALMQVVLEKQVGDLPLHPETVTVAAMNPPDETSGGYDLIAPLANRFLHVTMEPPPLEEWVEGMLSGWPTPKLDGKLLDREKWRAAFVEVMGAVSGFLHARPNHHFAMPENEYKRSGPWPSPRTWDMAARVLATARVLYPENAEVHEILLAGCVSHGVAREYWTWLREADLPDPEELLKNPRSWKPDRRADRSLAVVSGVVAAVLQKRDGPDFLDRVDAAEEVITITALHDHADACYTPVRVLVKTLNSMKLSKWPKHHDSMLNAMGPIVRAIFSETH